MDCIYIVLSQTQWPPKCFKFASHSPIKAQVKHSWTLLVFLCGIKMTENLIPGLMSMSTDHIFGEVWGSLSSPTPSSRVNLHY